QAVYTRTITAPIWGGRVTGKEGGIRYTALVSDDAGGGSAILPGPNDSSFASQDFGSTVFLGRAKRDIGLSFVGALVTERQYRDLSDGFRADAGFVPQVGYRDYFGGGGWQVYPKGIVSRERTFLNVDYQVDRSGALITRLIEPGVGMDTRFSGFLQFRYEDDETRAGDVVIPRHQFGYIVQFSPSRFLSFVGLNGRLGRDIDFANAR